MDADGHHEHHHHRLLRLPTLLPAVGVHHLLALSGTILFSTLVVSHPAVLLVLSSRIRHLLLVVPAGIGALPYFGIAFVRIVFPAAPYYVLGHRYGNRGLAWLEREAGGTPATVRWVEKAFDKARIPVVFLMPASNVVSLLAGHRRMPARLFGGVLVAGVLTRLVFIWFLGKALEDPLSKLLDWIQRYQWWIVAFFFAVSMVQSWRQVSSTQQEHRPEELTDEELEHLDDPAPDPDAPTS
jgi:membrane protein DedA with SNARE-associated domain